MSAVISGRRVRIAIWILLGAIVGAGVIWYAVLTANKPAPAAPLAATDAQLVRENSHRVTGPATEKAQLVEFLDFECESCRAAEPLVEELKKEYGDRITFVHRYFPLPGHRNSGTAALAVEAAAQQGKYQEMASKLFATQPDWGEKRDSQAALFRTFAQELGLDLAQYDAAVADQSTKDRISQDVADGKALGVTGTPTFFLNGKKLTLNTEAQFRQLLDEAAR
ncbi:MULTISPECIES: thioredoxin domain-containing protein [Paenarthrobacter]|uniref:DsbA family protein n=1 Tax=Paenarthrobacter ureafaciens TaxID=37931 RepID=A0AAX3EJ68_PAEUR|nr:MULTISPECIES: thioredoxin domain-containing protein [Paenarthrobacter]NKR13007.1 disulfide bond formation protein DsbA [Arthrobacter sp. M5]NKR16786.1 disulfide bond formation protein DsbA [Arthrobacter sp. M6]OEH59827.1 disulfide bond formation protein DsbA [Arthrobacter sp. D4]OEH60027.1 disulfide bond formation protein DsbA [Arthrobacter sp. D2]MDO5862798.1 DsbA family protein [Paenarthrobacter sp. SD-2]